MASRSSTVIISSAPIAKVGRLLTLTIAEISGTWLPFSLADGPLAPKCDSHHLETGPRIWLSPEEVLAPFYITQNTHLLFFISQADCFRSYLFHFRVLSPP